MASPPSPLSEGEREVYNGRLAYCFEDYPTQKVNSDRNLRVQGSPLLWRGVRGEALKVLTLFALICSFSSLHAQQMRSFFSTYPQTYFFINPAYAGFDSTTEANLWGRNSYLFNSFDIVGLAAGVQGRVGESSSGWGVNMAYDNDFYFTEHLSVNGIYSFETDLTEITKMQIGLNMGVIRRSDSIPPIGGGLFFGRQTTWHPALGFGILFKFENLLLGFSGLNLSQPRIQNLVRPVFIPRMFYAMARYRQEINEYIIGYPSILIRSSDNQRTVSLEGNYMLDLIDNFTLGLGVRISQLGNRPFEINGIQYNQSVNYVIPMVGARLGKNSQVLVTYDYPFNRVGTWSFAYLEGGLSVKF